MAGNDILAAPLADPAFGKLSPQDQASAVQRILVAKDKDFAKLSPADRAAASSKILQSRVTTNAPATDPSIAPTAQGFKTLGKNVATTAAGAAPVMMGAESGAAIGTLLEGGIPGPGTVVGGVAGAAFGGLAVPAAQYLTERAMGENPAPPTASEAKESAISNAEWSMIPGIAEHALFGEPLKAIERVLGISGASELADKGRAGAAQEGAKLQEQQQGIRDETSAARLKAGQSALAEHQKTIDDAEALVDKSRAKLRESKSAALEKARPEAAEGVAGAQAQQMVGKTPQQFAQEAAQTYGQRAQALRRAADPVFDASAKFHEEVGAKFEPYIGKIKNDPVLPHIKDAMNQSIVGVLDTLGQRGQRVESADLNKIIGNLRSMSEAEKPESLPDDTQILGGTLGDMKDPELRKGMEKRLIEGGYKPPEGESTAPFKLTYGQLWGYRARANRVLASSKNPADRWAAREVISDINDAIPGVPQEIRNEYAFERKMSRSVMGKVATARTPQEVGEAVFGSKANPEPAELPLQVIRFTKQYAPEQMDGIREAFADRYVGNRMDANDLAKMNHNVLTELYGGKADSVIRLVGPEGDAKMASWGQLIKADPAARTNLEGAIRDSALKQANLTQREALQSGQKMLDALKDTEAEYSTVPPKGRGIEPIPTDWHNTDKYTMIPGRGLVEKPKLLTAATHQKYDFIKQKMDAVKTTPEKLAILAKEAPDIEAAAKETMQEGASSGKLQNRFESYMHRRMMFMGLMFALGGYGTVSKRPGLVTAALAIGAGLGVRAGARAALTTENGASLYMKALDMRPSAANAATFGRIVGPIISSSLAQPPADQSPAPH